MAAKLPLVKSKVSALPFNSEPSLSSHPLSSIPPVRPRPSPPAADGAGCPRDPNPPAAAGPHFPLRPPPSTRPPPPRCVPPPCPPPPAFPMPHSALSREACTLSISISSHFHV